MHPTPAKLLNALPGLAALALACLAPVHASVLEKLVMPGRVVESHAQFEDDCALCHAPLEDVAQATLCLDCHEEIAGDITKERGFHGRDKSASKDDCVSCHRDHEGRDAKIVIFETQTFNHQLTDFLLAGAHLELSCQQCHAPETAWSAAPESCVGCHEKDDPHMGGLGPACGDCHSAANWIDTHFDHVTTGFPLLGAHQQTRCSGCHAEQDFTEAPDQCVDCHRSDDVHKGLNGPHCHDCHNPVEWGATAFDHRSVTGFALVGGHDGLTCQACHGGVKLTGLSGADCNACHQDDDVHQGNNGSDCGSCHQVRQWQTVSFDHAVTTGFLLRGAHSELACESCHTGPLEQVIPSDCAGCHEADDVHRAQLGSACDSCHGETAWTSQVAFDHDFTSFPLLGQHGTLMCESCHASAAFHDAEDNCAACHGDDDSHGGRLGSNCAVCHNPSDWEVVSFDHNEQTEFSLTGAHITASCVSCHRNSGEQAAAASVCGQCHRRDDKHSGRFGQDCARCHTTDSFREVIGL